MLLSDPIKLLNYNNEICRGVPHENTVLHIEEIINFLGIMEEINYSCLFKSIKTITKYIEESPRKIHS